VPPRRGQIAAALGATAGGRARSAEPTIRYRSAAGAIEKIRSTLGPSRQILIGEPAAAPGQDGGASGSGTPAPRPLPASLARVWQRIRAAEQRYGRAPGSVALLAVTKAFGPEAVAAAATLGQRAFGENYAQEAIAKMAALGGYPGLPQLEWHFIGPIQSNKTRLIAEHFQWVQSIDRLSIAQRLSAQRPPSLPALQVLLEVNVSGEASKGGVTAAELDALAAQVALLPQLQLRGLMAIPQAGLPLAGQRASFAQLRELLERLREHLARPAPGASPQVRPAPLLDILSMGMSADFEAAIAEGSTMVRVGSAIFGERP